MSVVSSKHTCTMCNKKFTVSDILKMSHADSHRWTSFRLQSL